MPHRPEDTAFEPQDHPWQRQGETPNPSVEGSKDSPRTTADTQPPAPGGRHSQKGQGPKHGERH